MPNQTLVDGVTGEVLGQLTTSSNVRIKPQSGQKVMPQREPMKKRKRRIVAPQVQKNRRPE